MGSSGIYRTDLPNEAIVADLTDLYLVTAASNSRYSVSIEMSTVNYWRHFTQYGTSILNPYGGSYWSGEIWLDTSSVSDAASVRLEEPAEQFEREFWDVESEASAVGCQVLI